MSTNGLQSWNLVHGSVFIRLFEYFNERASLVGYRQAVYETAARFDRHPRDVYESVYPYLSSFGKKELFGMRRDLL